MTTKTKVSALLTTIALALMGVGFLFTNGKTTNNVIKENIEALSERETTSGGINTFESGLQYCRCKKASDGVRGCYGGNWLSFRASCKKVNITADLDCHALKGDENCLN